MGRRSLRLQKPEEGEEKNLARLRPGPAHEKKKKKKKHRKNKENRTKGGEAAALAKAATVFQRKKEDGTTSLAIVTPGDGLSGDEKPVTLGMCLDRVRSGTSSLASFREDRRNLAKPMYPIYYGGYSSHGPTHDSTFANLTVAESVMVGPYFDFRNLENEELIRGVCGTDYSATFVDHLLDLFSGKEVSDISTSSKTDAKVEKVEKADKEEIDFDLLRTLEQDGIDVSFMAPLQAAYQLRQEQEMKGLSLEEQLELTARLIESLASAQTARLSTAPPPSLSLVAPPSAKEMQLADRVVSNLTLLTGQVTPEAVTNVTQLRKAMGVSAPPPPATSGSVAELPATEDTSATPPEATPTHPTNEESVPLTTATEAELATPSDTASQTENKGPETSEQVPEVVQKDGEQAEDEAMEVV